MAMERAGLGEVTERVGYLQERQVIRRMIDGQEVTPRSYLERRRDGDLGRVVGLARTEKIEHLHGTPIRLIYPAQEGNVQKDLDNVDFWVIFANGFGGAGPVLEAPAKLMIKKAQELGWRAGAGLVSTLGAEGSMKAVLPTGVPMFGDVEAGKQISTAIGWINNLVGKEIYLGGLIGHSMFGNEGYKWFKVSAGKIGFERMVGCFVTPVVAGPEYTGLKPAWLGASSFADLDKELARHVRLLTDWRNFISQELGVELLGRVNKMVGSEWRVPFLELIENKIGFVSKIVRSYTGQHPYGGELIIPVHVREYIENEIAIKVQIEMLKRMNFLAGDQTVERVAVGNSPPFMVVVGGGDQTLTPEMMETWSSAMGLADYRRGTLQNHVLLRESGGDHYPGEDIWGQIMDWQLGQITSRLK